MRLSEFLKKEHCIMSLRSTGRQEAIEELTGALAGSGRVKDPQGFVRQILEREALGSTGVGNHVAIPHARTTCVQGVVVAFGRSNPGVDFGSQDGQEIFDIFLIGTHPDELNIYLRLLAQLAKLLHDKMFRNEFNAASTPEEIIEVIRKFEKSNVEVTR